jgi:hypothetical protein
MEPKEREYGWLRVEGANTGLRLRCDAIAADIEDQALVVSAAGPESAVKALIAVLRSDAKVQLEAEMPEACGGDRYFYRLKRWADGYTVYRAKLAANVWHVLAVAKREGLILSLSEESLWQALRSDKYTTPILREWTPWLMQELLSRGYVARLRMAGCQVGLLVVGDEGLDELVTEGIRTGALAMPKGGRRLNLDRVEGLDGYLTAYGPMLGKQAERSLDPLHVPGRDPLPAVKLLRQPFAAQSHVIAATVKALRRQKATLIVAECGSGKTLMGAASIHQHAAGRPYRALVFCPGTLTPKWARELTETLPGVTVRQIESWRDLLTLDRAAAPAGAEWYVIARDRAKLGAKWRAAYIKTRGGARCPDCGGRLVDKDGVILDTAKLARKRCSCEWVYDANGTVQEGCGAALWTMTGELRRYEPALYIKRRLRGFFDYLIVDEMHQVKGHETAQANAAGALMAACRKVIAMTGTLVGGYAENLRSLLFRLSAASLTAEGLVWDEPMPFNERYGRIETRITEKSGGGDDNRQSRGSGRTTTKSVRPGIMPPLFGRHLLDKAVFLSLAEVAGDLPPLSEECIPVEMDGATAAEYDRIEKALKDEIKQMIVKGDRRLLGKMLTTLLAYPDHPFGWKEVGYMDGERWHTVVEPANLDESAVRPKEQSLIDLCREEKAAGRQVWVFVQYTDTYDVQGRLERLLKEAGLRVGALRASVSLAKREEWIARNGPKYDVVISHPQLVETGLDLFDKGGKHNFVTLLFYETGYVLPTIRQASRRAWRIGQREPCRVVYMYYAGTMQARALALMGKKMAAAQALEGKFCTDGLTAMGGDEGSVEMALAKSLAERLDEGDVRRAWVKVGTDALPVEPVSAVAPEGPTYADLSLFAGMDGPSFAREMRRGKVTVRDLADRLGVTQAEVRRVREAGLVAERATWLDAVRQGPGTWGTAGPGQKPASARRAAAKSHGRKLR